jgi:DnaJ-class molecular chaperone
MPIHDPYGELGLDRKATDDDIGRAFRKLAARYHPDRNPGDPAAEEKFKRIAEAYRILHDPKARAAFDRGGEEEVRVQTGFRGFDTSEDVMSHFGDLLGGLFGGRVRHRAFRDALPGFMMEEEPQDGESSTLEREVRVDVATAALGGTVDVPLPRGGVAEMRLPPGTQPGQVFRLAGQGLGGDLFVRVRVDVPRTLSAEQRRLLEALRRTIRR